VYRLLNFFLAAVRFTFIVDPAQLDGVAGLGVLDAEGDKRVLGHRRSPQAGKNELAVQVTLQLGALRKPVSIGWNTIALTVALLSFSDQARIFIFFCAIFALPR